MMAKEPRFLFFKLRSRSNAPKKGNPPQRKQKADAQPQVKAAEPAPVVVQQPTPVESSNAEKGKNAPKLTDEQRQLLLEWLAAGYSTEAIRSLSSRYGIPTLDSSTYTYYRKTYGTSIEDLKKIRFSQALETGLARREERVLRLKQHADELEVIKWVPDANGRCWNEKAWRETLNQIAEECGDTLGGQLSEVTLHFARRQAGDDKG